MFFTVERKTTGRYTGFWLAFSVQRGHLTAELAAWSISVKALIRPLEAQEISIDSLCAPRRPRVDFTIFCQLKQLLEMTQAGHFTAFVWSISVRDRKAEGQGRGFRQRKNKCGKNEWTGFKMGREDGWDRHSVLSAALTNGCGKVVKYLRPAMLLQSPLHQKVAWENKQGIWL